jgi:glycosyltransferase involved in cell wall biosynthesis
MSRVFVIAEYYLPGYKAGGAIRSVANLVDCMSDQFDFWILTRDRDATDSVAYSGIKINTWSQLGKTKVYYASPDALSRKNILQLIRDVEPNIYYLNSFFSNLTIKVLLSRRLGMLPESPVILAPRGEFSPGALRLKKTKKEIYMGLASRLGLYDDITWQVASAQEEAEVYAAWRREFASYIAPDLPHLNMDLRNAPGTRPPKEAGHVKLAFLSRITRKKNLAWALRMLRRLSGHIEFDIYGPPEDRAYWRECEQRIAELPENIRVTYHGPIPNSEVGNTLQHYHFFFFPTLGESFGHAIFDALAAGCPAIISDTTPWQDLSSKGAGWSIPLGVEEVWKRVLQECVEMDEDVHSSMSRQAREYALNFIQSSGILQLNRDLFLSVLNGSN